MLIVRQMDDRRMFAIWRFNQLWQSVTKKGQGRRMGGGKGAIDHYVFPFRAERILLEVGGHCEFEEVYPLLKAVGLLIFIFCYISLVAFQGICLVTDNVA